MSSWLPDPLDQDLSASGLAGRTSAQERLPFPFTTRARVTAWLALGALAAESCLYSLPSTRTSSMLKFVSDWELDFLNVWGWGTATLITVAAATLALTVLALLTLGFWRGPAWMHVAIIPAPFIAGAAAIPLLLFAVLWLAVVIIRIAMVIGALIFLFHILKGLFE